MATPFPWTCPYCNRAATITDISQSRGRHDFNNGNREGTLAIFTEAVICPNPDCREYVLEAALFKMRSTMNGLVKAGDPLASWTLIPKSGAKPFPNYIPAPILDDYREACLILNDSPKASATLSRRCLQGMIRDFWGIVDKTLALEITTLQGKIDSTTWAAIDAVRGVGNIGAHMEKDINIIVDVEPDEAQQLIVLIEFLLKDWYIGRQERAQHMQGIVALAAAKMAVKKGPATP